MIKTEKAAWSEYVFYLSKRQVKLMMIFFLPEKIVAVLKLVLKLTKVIK